MASRRMHTADTAFSTRRQGWGDRVSFDWSDAKERVRAATDIVELVGDYLQLRREGRGFKALCPWHDDSRPSLQINPERQSFKCWVCDIGGDVFTFKMKMDGVDFAEALRLLADKAGIALEPVKPGMKSAVDEKRELLDVLAWAEQRFHAYLLSAPEAEPARKYLDERGITAESISRFRCGYSPNRWDWLVEQARQTSYSPKLLAAAGLTAERQNGPGHYDRFRGRVLFSIRDPQSRAVGFGGRVLPGISDDSPAKYVNSPETPLFQKSGLLYALDLAKDAIQKSGTAVVMEGYTDVIIAHQCGFKNAVAVLGTALGERHVKLLKRFCERVVLMLDGDEAGQRRTDEVLELFISQQVDLRILTLPDELDPADFLLERGAEALESLLVGARDALEHKYRTVVAGLGPNPSTHQLNAAIETVLAVIAKAPYDTDRMDSAAKLRIDQTLVRLAQLSGVSEDRLRQRLMALRRAGIRPPVQTNERGEVRRVDGPPQDPPIDNPRLAQAERFLMEIIVAAPELLPDVRPLLSLVHLQKSANRTIYDTACELADSGVQPDFDQLMQALEDPAIKSALIDLDEGRRAKNRAATAHELLELARVLSERSDGVRRGAYSAPAEEIADLNSERMTDPMLAKAAAMLQSKRIRQGISLPTDG